MPTWLVLSYRRTLRWLKKPRSWIIIISSALFVGATYLLFDHPAVGLALKTFAIRTLPHWISAVTHYAGWSVVKRWANKSLMWVVIAFTPLIIRELFVYLKTASMKRVTCFYRLWRRWWNRMGWRKKAMVTTLFICCLWIPLGVFTLYLIPMIILKDLIVRIFRMIIGWLGLRPVFERFENWCAGLIPQPVKDTFHGHVEGKIRHPIRTLRGKIEKRPGVVKFCEAAKARVQNAKGKIKEEAREIKEGVKKAGKKVKKHVDDALP